MAINFSTLVYSPCQDMFGREVFFTPFASQPGAGPYAARGIPGTRGTAVVTDVGMAVLSDQETILDIREVEFGTVPQQGDRVDIPVESGIEDMVGAYEVTDAAWNGGGEITLTIRKLKTAAPESQLIPGLLDFSYAANTVLEVTLFEDV